MKPTKIAKISPASNKQWASRKLEFHSSENQKVSSEQKFQNFLESWVKFEWKTRVKLSDALTRQIPVSMHYFGVPSFLKVPRSYAQCSLRFIFISSIVNSGMG